MSRKKKKVPLLPQNVTAALTRGLVVVVGFLCVVAGLLGIVALFSYCPTDASLNTAGGKVFSNALGSFGALVADGLWQGLGIAAVLPVVAMVVWGAWLVFKVRPSFLILRFVAFLLAIVFLSGAFAGFNLVPSWPVVAGWGGTLGTPVFTLIFKWMDVLDFGIKAELMKVSLASFMLLIAAIMTMFAFAISWKVVGNFVIGVGGFVLGIAKKIGQCTGSEQRDPDTDDELHDKIEPKMEIQKKLRENPKPAVKAQSGQNVTMNTGIDSKDGFLLPDPEFLTPKPETVKKMSKDELTQNARRLEAAFEEYGVKGEVVNILPGPVVTLYEFNPAFGVRSTRVISLADEIARSMCAKSVRIALIPGRSVLGIELPNEKRETVFLRELIDDNDFVDSKLTLPLALGKNIGGKDVFADLVKMPHLLVAGTTGSGKSVAINTMILSLLYKFTPEQCRMIMVDPKMLELSIYNDIPHLLTPVVTEPKKAVVALKWAVKEMEDRYHAMAQIAVRNIEKYNEKLAQMQASGEVPTRTVQVGFDSDGLPLMQDQQLNLKPFPYIVVIVDEMADLMLVAGKEVEAAIQRLAQMARAAGIHLIMATQRPSVDVITGTIKANFPTRISFQVTSKIDSRTILNEQGAETLLGRGDMLFMEAGQRPIRVHGPFVSDDEVEQVVEFLKNQGKPEYLDAVVEEDEASVPGGDGSGGESGGKSDVYAEALDIVRTEQKVSISYLQRRLGIGYNRAADIVEKMEKEGIVSAPNHTGKREVLVQ